MAGAKAKTNPACEGAYCLSLLTSKDVLRLRSLSALNGVLDRLSLKKKKTRRPQHTLTAVLAEKAAGGKLARAGGVAERRHAAKQKSG